MVLSRAAFGVNGQKVPGVISWLTSIGWETFLAILAVLATSTIFEQLGWGGGTATKIVAAAVVALLIVAASVAGYHIIMRMQSVLTWVTGIVTVGYILLTLKDVDWRAVQSPAQRLVAGGRRRARAGDDRLRAGLDQHRRRLVALPAARRLGRGDRRLEHLRRGRRPRHPGRSTGCCWPGPTREAQGRHRGRPDRHPRHAAADLAAACRSCSP